MNSSYLRLESDVFLARNGVFHRVLGYEDRMLKQDTATNLQT